MGDKTLERLMEIVKETYNSGKNEKNDLEKKLKDAQSEVKDLKKKMGDAKKEKDAKQVETDATARRLRAERAEAREQLRKKNLDLQAVTAALQTARRNPQVLQGRVDDLTVENDGLKARITDLEVRNEALSDQMEELKRLELNEWEDYLANLKEEEADVVAKINQKRAKLNPAAAAARLVLPRPCGLCSVICVCALDTPDKRALMRRRPMAKQLKNIDEQLSLNGDLMPLLRREGLAAKDKIPYKMQRKKDTLIAALAKYVDKQTDAAKAAAGAAPSP